MKNTTVRKRLFADENHNLWILLRQVNQAVNRLREQELMNKNITPEQAEALFCIKVIGQNVTPSKLARCIIKQPHSTSALIDRMTEKGLVIKNKDLPSKNMVHIKITEKGEAAFLSAGTAGLTASIFQNLDENEKHQLRKILEKLRDTAFAELGLNDRPIGPPPLGKMVDES